MNRVHDASILETLYLYSIPGMEEKIRISEREEGIPFSGDLEEIPDMIDDDAHGLL